MRAILLNSFRSPPYISKISIPQPIPKTPCALIKVKTAQANPNDFAMIRGIYFNKD